MKVVSAVQDNKKEGKTREEAKTRAWKIAVSLVWAFIIVVLALNREDISISEILSFTPSNMFLAAVVMLGLFALKSVSIVIFSGILYAVNGILFPLPLMVLMDLLGTAVMVTVPYIIGKKLGAQAVGRITEKYPKAEQIRRLREQNDFFFVFIMRIVGVLPADIVSLYSGAAGVDYAKYLAACILGMMPPAITMSVMGMSAADIGSPAFIISLCVQLALMAASFLCYRSYRKKHMPKA